MMIFSRDASKFSRAPLCEGRRYFMYPASKKKASAATDTMIKNYDKTNVIYLTLWTLTDVERGPQDTSTPPNNRFYILRCGNAWKEINCSNVKSLSISELDP